MATFISLTRRDGIAVRVNVDQIVAYDGAGQSHTTVLLAINYGAIDAIESPEQIDALIADAQAPRFTCRSCGSVGHVEDHAPDDSYGPDICGRCWEMCDRAAVTKAASRLH